MLTRRQLRIKVFQQLYAYYNQPKPDLESALEQMSDSLNSIYTLYLYEMQALLAIHRHAIDVTEQGKKKLRPTDDDKKPNVRFLENPILQSLAANRHIESESRSRKVSWTLYDDLFRKLYLNIRDNDETFRDYLTKPDCGIREHKFIVKYLYATYVTENENLHQIYEDLNLYWADDLEPAQMLASKTLKAMPDEPSPNFEIPRLFKDEEDRKFPQQLMLKVTNNYRELEEQIASKTRNWDKERLAFTDRLLMIIALAELRYFPEIPVKVSLNEYIELSKLYSTPKSAHFINGVLDKLVSELTASKQIVKMGRGLL